MIENEYSYGADTVDIESISISSDCSNTWGIASKAHVLGSISEHETEPSAHAEVVERTELEIDEFVAVSGVPHLECLFDKYGNRIFSDGTVFYNGDGPLRIVKSSSGGKSFESYSSAVESVAMSAVSALDGKEYRCVGVGRVSVDGNVISADVPPYVLPVATQTELGGVTVLDSPVSESVSYPPSSVFSNSATNSALESKQANAVYSDDSLAISGGTVSVNFGEIGNDTILSFNRAVSGGAVYSAVSSKCGHLSFDEAHFLLTSCRFTAQPLALSFKADGAVSIGNEGIPSAGALYSAIEGPMSGKQNKISFASPEFTKSSYSKNETVSLSPFGSERVSAGSEYVLSGGGVYGYFKQLTSVPYAGDAVVADCGSSAFSAELENGRITTVDMSTSSFGNDITLTMNIPSPTLGLAREFSVYMASPTPLSDGLKVGFEFSCKHGGTDYGAPSFAIPSSSAVSGIEMSAGASYMLDFLELKNGLFTATREPMNSAAMA